MRRPVAKFTRNPIGVDFESKDGGKLATYYGRWVSRRGEMGSWSLPVSMHIAARANRCVSQCPNAPYLLRHMFSIDVRYLVKVPCLYSPRIFNWLNAEAR